MSGLLPEAERLYAPATSVQTELGLTHADQIQTVTRLGRAIQDRCEYEQTLGVRPVTRGG
jgi:hypothetical protein